MNVPEKIDKMVLSFCNKINQKQTPLFIKHQPEESNIELECIENVNKKVKEEGGERALGWAIWINHKVFIEAEFHAVYKNPENELINITPIESIKSEKILFLEDPNRRYKGYQINNIRKNISKLKEVDELIKNYNKVFELKNKGSRKFEHGEIILKDEEALYYQNLMDEQEFLIFTINRKI